jgi:hypothetical protein
MTLAEPYENNLAHQNGALLVLNLRLHRQVLRWRATHHAQASPDELLGLCISDPDVDRILDGLYAANAPPEADALDQAPIETLTTLLKDAAACHQAREAASLAAGVPLRLNLLAERLGLDAFEQQVVLLTLAPEMNQRYERLFGYLNDDITRRWPSVALALELFCEDWAERINHRQAFTALSTLHTMRIVQMSEENNPLPLSLLSRGLKLDERLVAYLLGSSEPDLQLRGVIRPYNPEPELPIMAPTTETEVAALADYIRQHPARNSLILLHGPDTLLQTQVAAHLTHAAGTNLLILDGVALNSHPSASEVSARVLREVRLSQSMLAIQQVDQLLTPDGPNAVLRDLLAARHSLPWVLLSPQALRVATLAHHSPFVSLHLPAPDTERRTQLWQTCLNGKTPEINLTELADRFRLTSGQIATAASQAQIHSAAFGNGNGLQRADLFASCRSQSSTALGELSQRVETIHGWDDLIVPGNIKSQLKRLEHWVRYRHVVYGTWGFDQRVMLGRGLAVLFSGASGTGKTMAAGILAKNLELDLYRIDLSTVVSKYIGETEKNLSRIFAEAESANAILFFDEADALFGKRSEVKDAHDRYANIEVSYLLQRMEAYDGLTILATNFRQNLDQAFTRRLQVMVEFPLPQPSDRDRIWRRLFPSNVPQAEDIDWGFLAHQFSLSGGNIKNCALTAAFAAAAEGDPVGMRHLVQAVVQEMEKLDQPIVSSDFGTYEDLVRNRSARTRRSS